MMKGLSTGTAVRTLAFAGITVLIVVVAALAVLSESQPTKGVVPEEAWLDDGTVDLELVPDYIVAFGRDGAPVGYVARSTLFPDDPTVGRVDGPNPVLAENLIDIVGHMVDGKGFVPIGTPFDEVEPFTVSTFINEG